MEQIDIRNVKKKDLHRQMFLPTDTCVLTARSSVLVFKVEGDGSGFYLLSHPSHTQILLSCNEKSSHS